jgi:putative sterol carrier protein
MILPIGSKSNKFRKWSSNWEGPYRIEEVIPEISYMVQSIQVASLSRALNKKYLKKYYLVLGKTRELKIVDNEIVFSTKMADKTPCTSPTGQIWSKNVF